MRVLGWICFVLGIVLGLLFIMAKLGGGDIPLAAYIVSGMMILLGLQLKAAGKGLTTASPPSAAGTTANSPAATQQTGLHQAATVELPFTPRVAEIIRASTSKSRRLYLVLIGSIIVFLLGLGVLLDRTIASSPGPDTVKALPILAVMSLGVAVLLGGLWFLQFGWPAQRDLRESTYLRTTGPVRVAYVMGGNLLRLADRAFNIYKTPAVAPLAKLDWAIVDYSRHAHVILGVWDRTGANVFSASGYQPESRILSDAKIGT